MPDFNPFAGVPGSGQPDDDRRRAMMVQLLMGNQQKPAGNSGVLGIFSQALQGAMQGYMARGMPPGGAPVASAAGPVGMYAGGTGTDPLTGRRIGGV